MSTDKKKRLGCFSTFLGIAVGVTVSQIIIKPNNKSEAKAEQKMQTLYDRVYSESKIKEVRERRKEYIEKKLNHN